MIRPAYTRKRAFVAFLVIASLSATVAVREASAQTIRSTRYSGVGSGIAFDHEARFDATIPMTVEGWVYREDASRCETILSHDYLTSFWFGFCSRLRFYRSGVLRADATVDVPARQWVHVAASYDGSTVRFYVDGQAAGASALGNGGANRANRLWLGADPNCCLFKGYLDEIRLWSVARSQSQIRADMFKEVRSGDGLVAVFDRGGRWEVIQSVEASGGAGFTESVFGVLPRDLIVPRSALPVTVDGDVDTSAEYLGAEQMVIRYRDPAWSVARDAVAYLVHDDNNLYVGVSGLRHTVDGSSSDNSFVSLFVNPNYSRTAATEWSDFQVREYIGVTSPGWLWGEGRFGGWESCQLSRNCPPVGDWQVAKAACVDDVSPPCLEFRVAKARLGEWDEVDGFALGQFGLSTTGEFYMAPSDADYASPATWVTMSYGEGSANLPRATVSGHVYNDLAPDRFNPLEGHRVYFGGYGGGPQYSQMTDSNGAFHFEVPVPFNMSLRLEVEGCGGCRLSGPEVSGVGIQTTSAGGHIAIFPGCPRGTCEYASIDFFVYLPPPPVSLSGFSPPSGNARWVLREGSNPDVIEGDVITLHGTNLHDLIDVALTRSNAMPDPADWWRVPTEIIERDAAGTWVMVKITASAALGNWTIAVRDLWPRLGYSEWNFIGPFQVIEPPFTSVHGFGFDNVSDFASLGDFFSVYGNNGYMCLGLSLFGTCLGCRVPDFLYLFYYPIYSFWVEGSGGSCMGMSATSLLLKKEILQTETFSPDVHYPNGFDVSDWPAEYDWDLCGPPEPTDLWGHIRVNHGVQTSAEAIQRVLVQLMDGNLFSIHGNPNARLEEVRSNPFQYVISMMPEVGRGHVVLPYAVADTDATHSLIYVYDNNYPDCTDRYIEVDRGTNTYYFPRSTNHRGCHCGPGGDPCNFAGELWSGRGMFTLPYTLFTESRSAPGLEEIALFIMVLVFGEADGLYTTSEGGEWGWR